MNREGKIQCRCILWHGLDFPFGSKYENFRGKQVQFNGVQEVNGIRLRVIQDFFNGFQPFAEFTFILTTSSFFVFPVCSKTLFSYVVHPLTSNLHFNPLSFVTHQSHMESLIAVGFRMADPVAQAVGMWLIYAGNGYIDVEAVIQLFFFVFGSEYDTYSQNIIDFFEGDVLVLHFIPNGIRRLDSCQYPIGKSHLVELGTNRSCEFFEQTFSFGLCGFQFVFYLLIGFWMFILEAQIL